LIAQIPRAEVVIEASTTPCVCPWPCPAWPWESWSWSCSWWSCEHPVALMEFGVLLVPCDSYYGWSARRDNGNAVRLMPQLVRLLWAGLENF